MQRLPERQEALNLIADEACARLNLRRDPAHDGAHARRVWRNARIIGLYASRDEQWPLDGDVLKAAAFLHDLGRGFEREDEHHAYASARIAEELLRRHELDALVWPVGQVILEHSGSLGRIPGSPESKILRDADQLDALGAIGIARCMTTGGTRDTPHLYHADDPLGMHRLLDDQTYIVDHFRTKLFGLAEKMHTRYARREAIRRTRVVRAFYDALLKEAGHTPEP